MGETENWIHPDVATAVNADDSIRPEARALMVQAVSRIVGATGDPNVVRQAIDSAKAGVFAEYLVPPNPPPAEPGSLAAIAERYKAAMGAHPPMGLGPQGDPPQFTPDQSRSPAAHPAPPAPAGSLQEVVANYHAAMAKYPAVGIARVLPKQGG